MLLTIYVPASEDTLGIKPGSGIVGSPAGEPYGIRTDYEGNLHNATNIVTWEDRLKHAAGRHVERYPTVARIWVQPEKLHAVGTYDTDSWSVVEITDQEAVDAWTNLWRPGRG